MARTLVLALLAAACGPESTSFRTTDRGDGLDRDGPPAAAYDVQIDGDRVANVHVWSNGGFISNTELPMTHIGFEITNMHATAIAFDSDTLELAAFDKTGASLPATDLTVVTPIGPAVVWIKPNTTHELDAYFELRVRPRMVESMHVRWSLRTDGARHTETTHFVRDDELARGVRPAVEPLPQM